LSIGKIPIEIREENVFKNIEVINWGSKNVPVNIAKICGKSPLILLLLVTSGSFSLSFVMHIIC